MTEQLEHQRCVVGVHEHRAHEELCRGADCRASVSARGMCHAHYQRYRRYGEQALSAPIARRTPRSVSDLDRFRSRLRVVDGCWLYTRGQNGHGYGFFHAAGHRHLAHRWAYEQLVGPVPSEMVLDHLCRNRACCNPDHLDVVTVGTNTARGTSPGATAVRTDRCKRGHELTEDNVYRQPGKPTERYCRACARIRRQARTERDRRVA